ncbi:hypothetical protein Bbelb_025120 [Branchiostoma belcheri]|nr:hypothetical protein Bbelb_025120 [Branchiostoma belcheri]
MLIASIKGLLNPKPFLVADWKQSCWSANPSLRDKNSLGSKSSLAAAYYSRRSQKKITPTPNKTAKEAIRPIVYTSPTTSPPSTSPYHIPLETGIPATVKKNLTEQFVDFNLLLPNVRSDVSDNLSFTFTIANRPPDPKHNLSLDQWTKAFLVYHFICAQRQPAHTCQLVS